MLLGADGNISVTANIAPKAMSEVCAVAIAKDEPQAKTLNNKIANLHNILFANLTQFL